MLTVAAVILLGGVAYFVSQRNQDSKPQNTSQAAQTQAEIVYLPLDGWDVSLHLEDDVRDAYVVSSRSDERRKVLSSPRLDELAKQVPDCVAKAAPVTIMRVLPGEIVDGTTYDIDTLNADKSYYSVNDYYYGVSSEPLCEIADTSGKIDELRRLHDQLVEHAGHIMTPQEIEQGNHEHHDGHSHAPGEEH